MVTLVQPQSRSTPPRKELEELRQGLDHEEAATIEPNARLRARTVRHNNEPDEGNLPLFERPSQCVVAAALLARQLP